ncbi:glutamyl/glutaminyl-tRNA synthetase, class Ic [Tanacetum coccineum]
MDLKKPKVVRSRKRPEVYLPHAEMGKVRLRFAPEPSGCLHIGQIKAVLLNQNFAQKFDGKQIMRFDDTNPAKENNEYMDKIIEVLKTMGIKYEEVTFTSDYFPQLMDMAVKLIKEGKAFVDDIPREQIQSERMAGIDSKCRNNTVAENIELWNEMIAGQIRGLQMIILWLRKVHYIWNLEVKIWFLHLCKRKALWFVENGIVDGWDDARFPTVQGMLRRGLKMDALIQFILEQGPSKNVNLMEWDKLWSINKKKIDPVCPRHTAIVKEGRVLLTLSNGPETPFVRKIPKHKRYEGAGMKDTTFTKEIWIEQADAKAIADAEAISGNLDITLMDWGNASIKEIKKNSDGNVTKLNGVLPPEGSVYKPTKLNVTWLPEINELAAANSGGVRLPT